MNDLANENGEDIAVPIDSCKREGGPHDRDYTFVTCDGRLMVDCLCQEGNHHLRPPTEEEARQFERLRAGKADPCAGEDELLGTLDLYCS